MTYKTCIGHSLHCTWSCRQLPELEGYAHILEEGGGGGVNKRFDAVYHV